MLQRKRVCRRKHTTQIFSGTNNTYIQTTKTHIYSLGSNRFGQLGINIPKSNISETHKWIFSSFDRHLQSDFKPVCKKQPQLINYFVKNKIEIVNISPAENHVFFISENNEIFCLGKNDKGQLGLGLELLKSQIVPIKNTWFEQNHKKVKKISCGINHTIFLDEKGCVWSVGSNQFGELGLGDSLSVEDNDQKLPRLIKFKNEIVDIFTHPNYAVSFFKTKLDRVFVCGYNEYERFGFGNSNNFRNRPELLIFKPALIKYFENKMVVDIVVGKTVYYLTSKNDLYVCGKNCYKGENSNTPILLQPNIYGHERIFRIVDHGGNDDTLILSEKMNLFSVKRGNLIHKDVIQISSGYCGTFILLKDYTLIRINYNQRIMYDVSKTIETDEYKNGLLDLPKIPFPPVDLNYKRLYDLITLKSENNEKDCSKIIDQSINKNRFLEIVFGKNKKKIHCSLAIQSSVLKRIINEKIYLIKLEEKHFYYSVDKVFEWLGGNVPRFDTINEIKNTYLLSLRWKLNELGYFIVEYIRKHFENQFDDIIKLIYQLKDEKRENCLYQQCKDILYSNQEVIQNYKDLCDVFMMDNQKNKVRMNDRKTNPSTSTDELQGEFGKRKKSFNLKKSYQNHLKVLLFDNLTKNLLFYTLDKIYIKVHKEIMSKESEYFDIMLNNERFIEGNSAQKFVAVNMVSKYLFVIVCYLYDKETIHSLRSYLNLQELFVLANYCDKYVLKEMTNDVIDIINFRKNELSFLSKQMIVSLLVNDSLIEKKYRKYHYYWVSGKHGLIKIILNSKREQAFLEITQNDELFSNCFQF